MAREKFNLLVPAFWDALRDVVEAIEAGNVSYAVVGGAAAQIWIAALLTQDGDLSLDDQEELPLRLRTTRDIDISTLAGADQVLHVLNALAAQARPPVTVLSARAVRLRNVHVNLTIEPADVSGFEAQYHGILKRACTLTLRRGNERLPLRVESLEDLFGTKLTRKGGQSKDLLDLEALCTSLAEKSKRIHVAAIEEFLADSPSGRVLLDQYIDRYPEVFQK